MVAYMKSVRSSAKSPDGLIPPPPTTSGDEERAEIGLSPKLSTAQNMKINQNSSEIRRPIVQGKIHNYFIKQSDVNRGQQNKSEISEIKTQVSQYKPALKTSGHSDKVFQTKLFKSQAKLNPAEEDGGEI